MSIKKSVYPQRGPQRCVQVLGLYLTSIHYCINKLNQRQVTSVQCVKEFFDMLKRIISSVNGSIRKGLFAELQTNDPEKPPVLCLPDLCDNK